MKFLKKAAVTGLVIAAVVVLALDPASGASTEKNVDVARCADNVMIGSGKPSWRSESNVAGPVGVRRWPLRQMTAMRNGDMVTEAGILVEGSSPVTVKVPQSLRERVFLYYGGGPDHRSISFADSNGFAEVEFQPCDDRPRTIWPGGLRVRGNGSVHLAVEAEGKTFVLKLGRPQIPRPAR